MICEVAKDQLTIQFDESWGTLPIWLNGKQSNLIAGFFGLSNIVRNGWRSTPTLKGPPLSQWIKSAMIVNLDLLTRSTYARILSHQGRRRMSSLWLHCKPLVPFNPKKFSFSTLCSTNAQRKRSPSVMISIVRNRTQKHNSPSKKGFGQNWNTSLLAYFCAKWVRKGWIYLANNYCRIWVIHFSSARTCNPWLAKLDAHNMLSSMNPCQGGSYEKSSSLYSVHTFPSLQICPCELARFGFLVNYCFHLGPTNNERVNGPHH